MRSPSNCLFAKEIFEGNPLEVYKPLEVLINKHIDKEWDKSHLLSFTSKKRIAMRYALNLDKEKDVENESDKSNECDRLDEWDYIVTTIKLSKLNPVLTKYTGIYNCEYHSHKILLINVSEALNSIDGISPETIRKSNDDSEWLIMPLEPMPDKSGCLMDSK